MFRTFPEAEQHLPPGLAAAGEKSWRWIELPLSIPYFLLSISVITEEGAVGRDLFFSNPRDLLGAIAGLKDAAKDIEISLMSPGYVNGSGSWQMGKIREVWKYRDSFKQMFVMGDGTKLHFPPNEAGTASQDMDLIISL